MLRPYQQRSADASVAWMRQSVSPFLIEAVTAAGKSHVIADVAHRIHAMTGKRVLCIAPSAELVVQNREKYLATGNPASMFSASAGKKDLRHPVVFGSPLTIKNRIGSFKDGFALVVCDEVHGLTPTLKGIISEMRGGNPKLRVMGLTATPYRLGSGYIFRRWPSGRINGEDVAREPYFDQMVDRITGPELIGQGYLTPPVIGGTGAGHYDTAGMETNAQGRFDAEAVDKAYHGHGRLTAEIVADVVEQSRDRRGVMFFAATVRHAQEIKASLPHELSDIVTAETSARDRKAMISKFKSQRIKYLVNVGVLTTGFDAPHVDVIAILRKTESVGLFQQIIGRGLRLFEGKENCLVLDYTSNMADHCPDGDIFDPEIKTKKEPAGGGLKVECPLCGYVNDFSARPEFIGKDGELTVETDAAGYVVDLDGVQVETEWGPMPAHQGRRCGNYLPTGPLREMDRCSYRWTSKPCPKCNAPNDISARYCIECKAEIVDPNVGLQMDFAKFKSDPTRMQTDEVRGVRFSNGFSRNGAKTMRADWNTPHRRFSTWHMPEATYSRGVRDWAAFAAATADGTEAPETITYRKEESGFYRISGFNGNADRGPE